MATRVVLLAACAACCVGCQPYDAPPMPSFPQPKGGAFVEGAPLTLTFSEAIEPDTLAVRIWPDDLTIENEIVPGTKPLVATCTLKTSPCGPLTMTLDKKGTTATLKLTGTISKAGKPMILEVAKGLADLKGNTTGINHDYTFQFRKAVAGQDTAPVTFDDGVYILVASVQHPLPAILNLVSAIKVLPDGSFALAGAKGHAIDGAPKNTRDPSKVEVMTNSTSWVIFATGKVSLQSDGTRLLQTNPFDLNLPAADLTITLKNVRLFGKITKNPSTGKDSINGTLSFDKLILTNGSRSNDFPGDSTPFMADYVPPSKAPKGHPDLCSNLCGSVPQNCNPPKDFPGAAFCK